MIDAFIRSIFVSLIAVLLFSLVYGWSSVEPSCFVGFFLGTFTYWGGKAWWMKRNASK
jgi:hypothetical protein